MISLNLRHPLGKATTLLLFLFSAILWTSCDKEQVLSSENLIVHLSLKDGDKEYAAKVSPSSGALSVELPSGSTLPTQMTISLLEISPKARASTSLNSKLTLAAGRATITVTAENKATKEYTLIVTVKKNAAADLKSLIVSIDGKNYTARVSNSQASVSLPPTVEVPAFVTVETIGLSDEATASVIVGGRIDLTNGTASIVVTAEDGTTTRSYTLEVRKEEGNQANLVSLSIRFGERVYEATITGDVATFSEVSRSITRGTITVIDISEGARSSVIVDGVLSFTDGEGQLIVTASDGQTSKTITVKLEGAALSTEAELSALSLTIGGVTYVATISGTVATVLTPQVVTSASVASLSYATGATSSVEQGGALTFERGASTITITAADGKTTKVYQIVLAKEGDFLTSFSFQVADNSYTSPYTAFTTSLGEIDQTAGTIEVELSPYLKGVELASLVPSFTTIGGATVVVGTVAQESGKTPNNFENDVTYTVGLAGTTKQYTVSVELSNLAWIPDANFRSRLKRIQSLAGAFTPKDSLWTNHSSVTGLGVMAVSSSSISSMMGLEFFTGLTSLYCTSNNLTDLDVSKNTALTLLYCNSNDLTVLDMSKNTALTNLYCNSNDLTVLDVSKNIALTELDCSSNQLTSLDLRAQQLWRTLRIDAGITENDVVQNPLTTLHVHEAVKDHAEFIEAKQNLGGAVTISTYNTAGNVVCEDYDPIGQNCAGEFFLTSFSIELASNNMVTTHTGRTSLVGQIDYALDTKTVTVFVSPYEKGVDLTSLKASFKVKSGATVTVDGATQTSGTTPNDFSTPVTYRVISGSTTQEYTVSVKTTNLAWIPDSRLRAKLKGIQSLALAFTPKDSLTTDHRSVTGLTGMRVENSKIDSMTSLEFFTGLTELDCSSNQLTVLDVAKNTALTELDCSSNQLTVLDVAKNTGLTGLSCNSNDLTDLDVSKNIALTYLDCSSNQLTDLDLRAQQLWSTLRIDAGVTANDVVQNPLTTLHVHEAVKDHTEFIEAKTNRVDALTISTYNTAGNVVCEDYDPIGQNCAGEFFLTSFSIELASNTIVTSHTGRTSLVGQIDDESATKTVTVFVSPYEKGVDLTSLKASFKVKSGATVTVGEVTQTSGVTPNSFSAPVSYRVSSGSTTQEYTVSVKTTNLAWIPDPNFRAKLKDVQSLALAFTPNDSLITDHGSVTGLSDMRAGRSNIDSMMGLGFFIALTYLECQSNQLTVLDVSKNTGLTQLYCGSNQLTALDVSKNTGLTLLYCESNDLTSLDVSKNTGLTGLRCNSNDLTGLDVSKNTGLTQLVCGSSQLMALDVSQNTALTLLSCSSNQLRVLDVSKNIALTRLYCYSNLLRVLDLRAQQSWTNLQIDAGKTVGGVVQNPLTTLHVHEAVKDHAEFIEAKTNRVDALTISTYNTAGNVVCADYNPITTTCSYPLTSFSIDLASNNIVTSLAGRKSLVGQIDHESATKTVTVLISPYEKEVDLTSLKVSFEVKSDATVTVGGVAQLSGVTPNSFINPVSYSVSSGSTTQEYTVSVKTTNLAWIPDSRLRAKLKDIQPLAGAFTPNDSLITDHGSVTGLSEMRVESSSISSMMGLEFFTGLTTLYCYSNQLTSLDVSKNTALTTLYCYSNQLTSLDMSKNTALTTLYCYSNQLTSLDVSKNIALATLFCSSNQLTNLDVSKNIALATLFCSSNQLTNLDLRAQQSWSILRINAGETADGVVKNPLTTLHVHEDVKDNAEFIEAKTNRVDALTISTYTTAGGVVCEDYDPIGQICTDGLLLTSFSIEVASNNLVTTHTGRTRLVGRIDDESDPKTVTVFVSPYEKNVDLTSLKASFKVKSGVTVTVGGVAQTSGTTPNDFSTPVTYSVSSGEATQEYTVSVKETNLAWIPEANFRGKLKDALPEAAFTQNDSLITDHGSVTGLSEMRVESSNIDSMMGLEFFTGLTRLFCESNDLTALDVSKNTALIDFRCSSNDLTDLDLSKNTALTYLDCSSNDLTDLDVSKNTVLTNLSCHSNDLTVLDLSKNIALVNLYCDANDLTVLDVSKNIALIRLNCSSNQLTGLDVTKNIALTQLYCNTNLLTGLDVTKNIALTQLYCNTNLLTSLDVTKNTGLTELYCQKNQLTNLDVRAQQSWANLFINAGVTKSSVVQNPLTTLHVHEDVKDHAEVIEAKTNRVDALTISTYSTAGGDPACNNYDPRQSSRGCKD